MSKVAGTIATIAGLATLGIGGYFLLKGTSGLTQGVNGFQVVILSVTGGTVSPAVGSYNYTSQTTLHLVATPDTGYDFIGWTINGEQLSTNSTFSYTVTATVIISAVFQQQGASVVLPAHIKPVQNTTTEDHFRVRRLASHSVIGVITYETDRLYLESYEKAVGFVKFKIEDDNGNGVANQQIAVYTDVLPDLSGNGYLMLNDNPHSQSQGGPLIVTSGSDGIITVKVTYWWYEGNFPTYQYTLGQFAKIWASGWQFNGIYPEIVSGYWGPPIYNDSGKAYKQGDVTKAFSQFVRLKDPCYTNFVSVYAYWVKNPNLQVLGSCSVTCSVRWFASQDLTVSGEY